MSDFVVILDDGYDHYEVERRLIEACGARLEMRTGPQDPPSVATRVGDAVGVFIRESRIDSTVLAAAPRLKAISRYGVGIDNIDLVATAARGVKVANVPDYGVEDVSTHALALLLAVNRRIVSRDAKVRAGGWFTGSTEPMWRFQDKTLGLYGYGRIGACFHRKAVPLGFARVLVFDPYLNEAPAGTTLVDLPTLLAESDALSCHAPLTPQTRHSIDRAGIARMKRDAILVNTGRGGIIDEDALADALAEGRLFGAGLDVFEREPPDAEHRLFSLANVVVSDHTAWYTRESICDLQRKAAEEMARMLRGEDPVNWVNRPAGTR